MPFVVDLPTRNLLALQKLLTSLAMTYNAGRLDPAAAALGVSRDYLSRRLDRWGWVLIHPSKRQQAKFGIRPCANPLCPRLRTRYARHHWVCRCHQSEIPGHRRRPPTRKR